LFQHIALQAVERKIPIEVVKTRDFGTAPAPLLGPQAPWRSTRVAMTPDEASFARAGEWKITVPRDALNGLSDVYIVVRYQGDEARVFEGDRLLTDDFFNGTDWQIGIKRFLPNSKAATFKLQILPLSDKAPVFFEPGRTPTFDSEGQAGSLRSVEALPEYEMTVPIE